MVSGFLNRQHANRLILEQGLSALVLAQPESITYASGAFPGVATNWRSSGAAFLVVPCDATEPLTAIVGDLQADTFKVHSKIADVRSHPIWVETGRYDNDSDPENVARSLVEKDLAMGKPAIHSQIFNLHSQLQNCYVVPRLQCLGGVN